VRSILGKFWGNFGQIGFPKRTIEWPLEQRRPSGSNSRPSGSVGSPRTALPRRAPARSVASRSLRRPSVAPRASCARMMTRVSRTRESGSSSSTRATTLTDAGLLDGRLLGRVVPAARSRIPGPVDMRCAPLAARRRLRHLDRTGLSWVLMIGWRPRGGRLRPCTCRRGGTPS